MLGGYRIDPYGGLVDCPFSNMAGNLAMLVEAVPPPRGGWGQLRMSMAFPILRE